MSRWKSPLTELAESLLEFLQEVLVQLNVDRAQLEDSFDRQLSDLALLDSRVNSKRDQQSRFLRSTSDSSMCSSIMTTTAAGWPPSSSDCRSDRSRGPKVRQIARTCRSASGQSSCTSTRTWRPDCAECMNLWFRWSTCLIGNWVRTESADAQLHSPWAIPWDFTSFI